MAYIRFYAARPEHSHVDCSNSESAGSRGYFYIFYFILYTKKLFCMSTIIFKVKVSKPINEGSQNFHLKYEIRNLVIFYDHILMRLQIYYLRDEQFPQMD